MKNLFLFIVIIFITSCTKDEVIREVDNLSINESNFQLNLKSFESLGKEVEIKNGNVNEFLTSNFEELLTMEDDLELKIFLRKNKNTFALKSINNNDNNLLKADPPGFWDSETVCNTCRNEECVKSTLSEAVGEGNTDVDIRVRVKRTLGVQTGLEICYERYVN
ncbi:hypothetical protein LB452_11405 [Psychroflexus sp. CAK8W]|uniref:Lipoprotein n=1 Tax=Psychroflexus longus TaxID=2873596 RepID=A0ABS7XKM2_9FLAO|nr:hypothetical protein [Psychroflexus longus]MBZ9779528.1 hypothetical protein [Psychroflexus longus]